HSPRSSRNCTRGMMPSDFSPAWTVTQSSSMFNTTPVTMAPGRMSMVFRLSSNSSAKLALILATYALESAGPVVSVYRADRRLRHAASRHGSAHHPRPRRQLVSRRGRAAADLHRILSDVHPWRSLAPLPLFPD